VNQRTYEAAGVRPQAEALSSVVQHLGPTLGGLAENAKVLTDFGHYASVIHINDDLAVAISTDGVGSKTLVASALDRYDTIGFDCVAMNVNDVLCVGARPLALVDYIGVHSLDRRRLDDLLRGLGGAAKEAEVAIPGGELAQLPEIIGAQGDETAFDLVGTCIGIVHPDKLVLGASVRPGDALIGIESSGIHSNGLTLARRVLINGAGYELEDTLGRLGRTLGEELLCPTEIYVRGITALWDAGVETRGLAHITSDGLANLCRLEARVGYEIRELPPTPEIFKLISEVGEVESREMYRVFNMGIGFVVVTPAESAASCVGVLEATGYRAHEIGTVTDQEGVVQLLSAGLTGGMKDGSSFFATA
jgi:phosphoribosylformylglycinamidine cyclo-ligase